MDKNTQWTDAILTALNSGPLNKSRFYEVIPGFLKNKRHYDNALKILIADKRVESYTEAPYGKERTSFRLVVKEAGQNQDPPFAADETVKEQIPPDEHEDAESSLLETDKSLSGDEDPAPENPEEDSPECCDLDLIVLDADSTEDAASNASFSESMLFDDAPDVPLSLSPAVTRFAWRPVILMAIFALFLLSAAIYCFIPTASTTGQHTAMADSSSKGDMADDADPVLPLPVSAGSVLPELPFELDSPKSPMPPLLYVIKTSPPYEVNLRARTSTPAAILRSLSEGIPEGNNTARLYQVELSVLPASAD